MLDPRLPLTALVLGLLALGGCTAKSDPAPVRNEQPAPTETRLTLDVPPGLAVLVDGEAKGNTPLEPIVVSPGKHALEVDGPCGKHTAEVEAPAGVITRVSAERFAGLSVARLTVTAKLRDGTPVTPDVFLGTWAVPRAAGTEVQIPACTLRLGIASEGLGGFTEDVEFEAGKAYVRDVVLAPGPDMIRIAGGKFRMGPPGPNLYDPEFDREGAYEEFDGWPWIKTYEVDVPSFEIDRTEVTAEQFHACYTAGYCAYSVLLWGGTMTPDRPEACSTEPYEKLRPPKQGRAGHPANCVADWEAKKYCEWVGKRLPSDVEWEFAARSRKSAYTCSWGGGFSPKVACDRSGFLHYDGTRDVCSFPTDNTEQGLCDMMGSLSELVTYAPVTGRSPLKNCPSNTAIRGAQWGQNTVMPFDDGARCMDMSQSDAVGFRCARDVKTGSP